MKAHGKVKEVMTPTVFVISADATIQDAAKIMRNYKVHNLVVVSEKEVIGIVADEDIIHKVVAYNKNNNTLVGDIMTSKVVTTTGEESIIETAQKMNEYNISVLPVIDEKRNLVGVVSKSDLLYYYPTLVEYLYTKK